MWTVGPVVLVAVLVCGAAVAPAGAAPATDATPDARTLLSRSVSALAAQSGFQVTMTTGAGAQRATARVQVGGRGSVGVITQPGTGTVRVVGTARRVFLKGDAEFRRSLSRRAERRLGGRWLALSTGSAAGLGYGGKADGSLPAAHAFETLSSVRALVGTLVNARTSATLVGRRVIGDQPAVGVRAGQIVVWLRATGAPLPIQFQVMGGTPASGAFTDWGAPPRVAVPKQSVKAEKLPGMGRTRPTRGGGTITGKKFRNTLIAPGAGMVGIRLGDAPARVRAAVGKPYDITAGTNVFGPFSMWHFAGRLHVDVNGGRVVGLTLGSRGARTSDGIGIGSALSRLTSTYDVQCATNRGAVWTDCTLGDALLGAVVTTFRARKGEIREISIVRIVD